MRQVATVRKVQGKDAGMSLQESRVDLRRGSRKGLVLSFLQIINHRPTEQNYTHLEVSR
jgi:hypothetical protein